MTREQAIEELKAILEMQYENVPLSKAALEMAIKALEQEPNGDDVVSRDVVKEQMIMYGFHAPDMTVTEFVKDLPPVNPKESTTKNDLGVDCIDRAELLKAMDTWDKFGYTETGCFVRAPKNDCVPYVHYNDMVNCVKGMPSVTPQEPRKGEWCPQNDDYFDWYECSECGYGSEGEMQYSSEFDVRTNFCPNCGAKMVEPQESEDNK